MLTPVLFSSSAAVSRENEGVQVPLRPPERASDLRKHTLGRHFTPRPHLTSTFGIDSEAMRSYELRKAMKVIIHGDEGHSCYSEDGELTCVIAKRFLFNGPGWRQLVDLDISGDQP